MEAEGSASTTSSDVVAAPVQPVVPDYKGTKHRVKVEGAETEIPYEELLSGYQQSKASTKRFQEAAKAAQEADQILRSLKEDPWAAMQQLGLNPDELSERRVAERLEWELMPEDQRKFVEMQRKVNQYETKEKTWKQQQEAQEQQALQSQALQEIDTEIGEVLKSSGVKPSPKVVARVAEVMLAALERGERIPASKAYERSSIDLRDEVISHLTSLPIAKAVEMLPKEFVNAMRQHFVSKVTDDKPFSAKRPSTPPSQGGGKKVVKSTDELFKQLEEKFARQG